jgi:hypothetical protein
MAESTPTNPNQTPQYARGCDLSVIPLAADTPPADIDRLLGVETSNPFLRRLRIERGILNPANLPPDLTAIVPLDGDALAKLLGGDK